MHFLHSSLGLTFLVGVVSATISIPTDSAGQDQLLKETIASIYQFKEHFDSNPELYQADDGDRLLTVTQIIERYEYPVETHEIITEDGYILQAHRIPHGIACGPSDTPKRVVWLQHGLMGDSSNWIITGNKSRGLAFELADNCYDVWMGNFRGNTYSKRHQTLLPSEQDFWNFSWHEIGLYDIPASINYTLNATNAEQLYYIGHSMGCTAFFVGMSERPEYNHKVKLMSALAPAIFMSNTRSIVARIMLSLVPLFETFPTFETLPITLTKDLAGFLCKRDAPTQDLCIVLLFLIGGDNAAQLDRDSLPAILGHAPAGSSSKTFLHYAQSVLSGDFKQYDYHAQNPIHYDGAIVPPAYNLSRISIPIAIYYGDNDFLADRVDILRSVREFAPGTIVNLHRVEDDLCNHLDFIWAKDQDTLINQPVIAFMEEFTNPTITEGPGTGSGRVHLPGLGLLFASVGVVVVCFFIVV